MFRSVRLLGPEARALAPALMLTFLASTVEAVVLTLIVPLIEAVAKDRSDFEIDFAGVSADLTIREMFVLAVAGILVMTALYLLANMSRSVVVMRFVRRTRLELLLRYLNSDWPTTRGERQGKLQETLGFVQRTSTAIARLGSIGTSTASLLVFVGAAFLVDSRAALSILLVTLVVTLALTPLRRYQRALSRKQAKVGVEVAERVGEIVENIDDITVFGTRDAVAQLFRERDGVRVGLALRSQIIQGLVSPLYRSIGLLVVVAAVFVASGAENLDTTSFGAAALLLYRSVGVGQKLQGDVSGFNDAVGSVEALHASLDAYMRHQIVTGDARLKSVESLEANDVTFSYDEETAALAGIRLTIAPGELVGLAGPSGSGKSTLAQILIGLRIPIGGQYLVNGRRPSDYREADWRRAFALVPQTTRIVHANVADNIRYFRDGIDDANIERVARLAGIHETIVTLPNGYSTQIGPTTRALSGGQIQRIGIARALAGGPDVIVLDEPTSALDVANESIIHDALRSLRGSCIVVVIAHRRSTLEVCDRIVLLSDGRVGADGPADDVLRLIDGQQQIFD